MLGTQKNGRLEGALKHKGGVRLNKKQTAGQSCKDSRLPPRIVAQPTDFKSKNIPHTNWLCTSRAARPFAARANNPCPASNSRASPTQEALHKSHPWPAETLRVQSFPHSRSVVIGGWRTTCQVPSTPAAATTAAPPSRPTSHTSASGR